MPVSLAFVIELIFLFSLVLGLHWFSPKIGLLPMLFVVMTLTAMSAIASFINVYIFIGTIEFNVIAHIFVPLVIIGFLIIYIVHGVTIAQSSFASLVLINLLVMVIMVFAVYYLNSEAEQVTTLPMLQAANTTVPDFLRGRIASVLGFGISMLGSVIAYQFTRNLGKKFPEALSIMIAVTIALWLDSLVYYTIKGLGLESFLAGLQNDFLAKTIAALVLIIPTSIYISYFRRQQQTASPSFGRPIFGIIFGLRGQLSGGMRDMQSELRLNQQIYKYLTENLNEVIYLVDAQTEELIYISPAFETVTGHPISLLENKVDNLQRVVHPDDRVEPPLLDFMIRATPNSFRIVRPNGEIGWLHNRIQALTNEKGEVYRYLGLAEDMSEDYKQREREMQLELSQERVRIMNEFVRDASHDLKTPLSSMLLKIDMLQLTSGERHKEIQEELRERVMYLSHLIDDLFTLSLFEAKPNVQQEAVDLLATAQLVINDLDAIAQKKELAVSIKAQTEDCSILSTPDAMQRLFTNLISNAIRYTDKGSITLTFYPDDEAVAFSIRDTGIGIPQKDLENIFDRFYRSKNAKDYSREGTGLGLAICKAIVGNHSGSITVESELNTGTTFHVRLARN